MGELTIYYEGYWQCRQATDPDPSDDWRGASGYTYAVGSENDFDQIIRLQEDEIAEVDLRPLPGLPVGIFVKSVMYGGNCYQPAESVLRGGKVRWLPAGNQPGCDPTAGPKFELRNTITYFPTNGIMMPIVPFEIQIESDSQEVILRRDDPLDVDHPEMPIWQMADVNVYGRRCPVEWYDVSDEVAEAIGISPDSTSFNAYFQKRKEWLQLQLNETTDPVQRSAYADRLYAIQSFTSGENRRLENRLGLQAKWDYTLRGKNICVEHAEKLGGRVDTDPDKDWRVRFWMGGFDGDALRGYMRGSLSVPFQPNSG